MIRPAPSARTAPSRGAAAALPADGGAAPLVDSFGRRHTYLRISVTDRCNFRCVYCMPEDVQWQQREEILSYEEIVRLAELFVGLGVEKIRLTGGEPTVRRDFERLLRGVAGTGVRHLLMTTNGYRLAERAEEWRAAGLQGLNISLDTLRADRFAEITRTKHFDRVMSGIEAAIAAGYAPLKINVVVMAGVNDDEILDFVEFARERPVNVRFIEFMPFQGNGWSVTEVYPYRRMLEVIRSRHAIHPLGNLPGDVARDFAVEGFVGTLGFVTSMTESFCEACNRIRLTADGQIKSCLFGPAEEDLRQALRSGADDAELEERIRWALWRKPEAHPPMEELAAAPNRAMVQIGG
jgi:GTP 3',8-cyclase